MDIPLPICCFFQAFITLNSPPPFPAPSQLPGSPNILEIPMSSFEEAKGKEQENRKKVIPHVHILPLTKKEKRTRDKRNPHKALPHNKKEEKREEMKQRKKYPHRPIFYTQHFTPRRLAETFARTSSLRHAHYLLT